MRDSENDLLFGKQIILFLVAIILFAEFRYTVGLGEHLNANSYTTIPSLDKIFNQLISFLKNDTLF